MAARSAGLLLREAVAANKPLQIVGAINAYAAILADKTGKSCLALLPLLRALTLFRA